MAAKYWVGGSNTWDGSSLTKWATTSGGAGGASLPTAADDVFLDAASGSGTITLASTSTCRSLNCTGFTGTLSHPVGAILTVGDATAGASNIALKFVVGMTYTIGSSASAINFVSTSATQQTVETGGKTLGVVNFNGAGGSWLQIDALTAATIAHTQGTWNTGSFAVTAGSITSNVTGARTLVLGSSAITVTNSGNTWNVLPTNLTVPANTATVTFTNAAGAYFSTGLAFDWNGLSVVFTGAMTQGSSGINGVSDQSVTLKNLTYTGTAVKTNVLDIVNSLVITGTLTVNGNSATNRILIRSTVIGRRRLIAATNVSFSNVDFQDIHLVRLAAVGSVVVSDSFDRAAGNLSGSTTDSYAGGTGKVWSNYLGTTPNPQWLLDGTKVVSKASDPRLVNTGVAGHRVTATITAMPVTTGIGVIANATLGSNTYNKAVVLPNGSVQVTEASTVGINTNFTLPANTFAAGDTIGLEVTDSGGSRLGTIILYKNGTPCGVGQATTNVSIGGTYAGIGQQGNGGAGDPVIDDFVVTAGTIITTDTDLSAITGLSGDCGGNSGITFTASATQTATGTASFTWSTHGWTSRVPLPQDNVVIANAFVAGRTVTVDMPRLGKDIDFTGVTGSPSISNGSAASMYGSLTLAAGLPSVVFGSVLTLAGRSTHTITSAGKRIGTANSGITISAYGGGSYSLTDPLDVAGDIALDGGAFTTNSYNVQSGRFLNNTVSSTLTLGTTTWTILQTGAASPNFTVSTPANTTFSGASSTIVFSTSATPTSTRTFSGNGQTFGTVRHAVVGQAGSLASTTSAVIDTLEIGPGRAWVPTTGTTQTIRNPILSGQANGYQRLPGTTGNYISSPDSAGVSVTGDLTIRCRVALDDWTPWTTAGLVAKRFSPSSGNSYMLGATANGGLQLWISTTGTNDLTSSGSVAHSFVDGTAYWIEVTRPQATGVPTFRWAPDSPTVPSSWTTLGSGSAISAGSAIADTASVVEIGSWSSGTGGFAAGKFYRAQILDGSTVVFDADFTTKAFGADSFTEANGATVTINGVPAQVGDGRVAIASNSAGNQATLESYGAQANLDYTTVKDIAFRTPYKLYVGSHSVDLGNNQNVNFSVAPDLPYIRQHATAAVVSSAPTIAWPVAPLVGSLLVAEVMANAAWTLTSPAGWTLGPTQLPTSGSVPRTALWYKIADGTETTVTAGVNSGYQDLVITEVAGWHGVPTLDVTDSASSSTTSVTTLNTGAGVTSAAGAAFAFALFGKYSLPGTVTDPASVWQRDLVISASNYRTSVYRRPVAAATALSATQSWTTSTPAKSHLVVFKDLVSSGNFLMFM